MEKLYYMGAHKKNAQTAANGQELHQEFTGISGKGA